MKVHGRACGRAAAGKMWVVTVIVGVYGERACACIGVGVPTERVCVASRRSPGEHACRVGDSGVVSGGVCGVLRCRTETRIERKLERRWAGLAQSSKARSLCSAISAGVRCPDVRTAKVPMPRYCGRVIRFSEQHATR